ncbi:membrane protein [Rhizocola hellebori]|uniref:Membrane protein n=1 Tax=Rhizocola hellebori TaxID=1392758 RepID=A0A8J3Q656_9ACTN|nr:isoprenylcysteine carboxylmethyltransferase family protein [Rhizocola hellebori]GIH03983.1 membrane protein [Rhizocola hellebori]
MTKRLAIATYAVLAYAAFLLSVVWAVGFLAGRGAVTSVDGPAAIPAAAALAINGALLLAFAAQHTIMARAGFKQRLARLLPPAAERSTFVLVSSLLLFALFGWWQPVPATIWHVGPPWSAVIWLGYAIGWAIVVWSTFMIDHADFLGLKQAYLNLRRRSHGEPAFTERWLYAWCRHPMMLGLVIAFWAAPTMTVGHLFFAVSSTAYILVGIRFEERALRAQLGPVYEEYAGRVPALLPRPPSS